MGDCSCIKGESNFKYKLESLSSEVLLFQDLSDWMDHPNYKTPSEYTLSVTPPGNTEGTDIVIDLQKWNKITSKELFGSEDQSIPDGIYCLKVKNCGNTYSRYHAVVYKLECCSDQLFVKGIDIAEIDRLIRDIRKAAEFQDDATANKLYKIALDKMNLLNCEC